MVCSSPRASIGLSRLEASIAPSAAPAPTTVCSSSMNRTTWPSESLISLSTALRRSSNSPRYLAPAMSAPRSSATTRLSLRPSGTSPRTMRWARPSAIAVLPTPGSPMSTGLFLVRAAEHLDDAPDLLVAADDRVELAGARVARSGRGRTSRAPGRCSRGSGEVTRWPPRTVWSAPRIASWPAPAARGCAGASPPASAAAEQQVLGRDVLVVEPPGLVLGALEQLPGARVERQLAALRSGRGATSTAPSSHARSRPGRRRAGAASRPGCPRGSCEQRGEDVLGVERRGCSASVARRWAARMASWAFSV